MIPELTHQPRASVRSNGDFISILTCSGYHLYYADLSGANYLLSPDVGNAELGAAILDALARSRQIPEAEERRIFTKEFLDQSTAEWEKKLKARFGYKTKRDIYGNMMSCPTYRIDGRIEFMPTCHTALTHWSRTKGDGIEDVYVPADASPTEIGAALRLAFSRCR